jgi:hypothetical protein
MSELSDLLERFRRGPEVVAGASNLELDFVPAPGQWSVRQIVCHLADFEMVGGIRFRQVLSEDNPTLYAYDQNLWAEHLDHKRRKISLAVEGFRRTRIETYDLLKDLPETAFARKATHTERGGLTLLDMLLGYAEHAENHARQILIIRQAYKAAKVNG